MTRSSCRESSDPRQKSGNQGWSTGFDEGQFGGLRASARRETKKALAEWESATVVGVA